MKQKRILPIFEGSGPGPKETITDEWGTPKALFNSLDNEFDFTLDPCGSEARILKNGMLTYIKEKDGLHWPWIGHRVFVNPPYSDIAKWVKKCFVERNSAELIVLLIFSRTDTKYFHEYIYHHAELRFLKGRLKFVRMDGVKNNLSATFPSMLCIYRKDKQETKGYF